MIKHLALVSVIFVTGCANTYKYIPSFWDDNQSAKIIDVRQRTHNIDCQQPQAPQARALVQDLQWFRLYSDSKGRLQQDVIELIEPMQQTAEDWAKRADGGSAAYCEIKKKILITQADKVARAVLGRW